MIDTTKEDRLLAHLSLLTLLFVAAVGGYCVAKELWIALGIQVLVGVSNLPRVLGGVK